MKIRLITAAMLILTILTAGCSKTPQTNQQGNMPAPTTATGKIVPAEAFKNLSFINMFNEASGWAISSLTMVLREENGSWMDVSPQDNTGNKYGAAEFTDISNGWLAASKEGAANITILRTNDGGKTWLTTNITPTEQGITPTVKTINFIDNAHGWLAVSYGTGAGSEFVEVYQTINGGEAWTLVASPRLKTLNGIPAGGLKTGLSFIDANKGWLTGLWYGDTVWLYVTEDAGKTWKQQGIKVPEGYPTKAGAVETWPPMFFSTSGILPLTFHNQGAPVIFYTTDDKGVNWKAATPIKSTVNQPFIWNYANIKAGFATDHVQLFTTTDSGRTWKTVKMATKINRPSKNIGKPVKFVLAER